MAYLRQGSRRERRGLHDVPGVAGAMSERKSTILILAAMVIIVAVCGFLIKVAIDYKTAYPDEICSVEEPSHVEYARLFLP